MQDHNKTFSDRTDRLAHAWGITLDEAAVRIGISRAMFFGYRSGKYEISSKAMAKLVKAETSLNPEYLHNPALFAAPLKLAAEIAKAIGGGQDQEQRNFEIVERILSRALLPLADIQNQISQIGNSP